MSEKMKLCDRNEVQKGLMKRLCGAQWKRLYDDGWRVFNEYECPKCGREAVIIMAEGKSKNEDGHMECIKCLWRTF